MLPLVARWWGGLLVVTILCGIAGYAVASQLPPTYQASVQLLTGPVNTDLNTVNASAQLARTYAELATSEPLLTEVAAAARLSGGATALKKKLSVTSSSVTRLVTVTATASRPRVAAFLANRTAKALLRLQVQHPGHAETAVDALMQEPDVASLPEATRNDIRAAAVKVWSTPEAGVLTIVNPAVVPTSQSGPPVEMLSVLAALVGFILALLALIVRETIRAPIRSEADLAEIVPRPQLGTVSFSRGMANALQSTGALDRSKAAERYRQTSARLGLDGDGRSVHTLAVIDCDERIVAPVVAMALAAVAAERGFKVTVIKTGCDEKQLKAARAQGGSDVSSHDGIGDSSVQQASPMAVRSHVTDRISLVAAAPLRSPGQANCLLETVRSSGSEIVIIPLPAVADSSEGIAWSKACDYTVLLASQHRSRGKDVAEAGKTLFQAGITLQGTLLVANRRR